MMSTRQPLLLLLLAACLTAATAQQTDRICAAVCANPREVECPGPANASDCKEGQVFKPDGAFCRCCNACYTLVGPNQRCLANPSKGLYYQCPDGYTCSYTEYCERAE